MTEWIRDLLDTFGYTGVAFVMLLDTAFPLIPSELVLPLAGYFVFTGDLSFWPTVAAATIGSVAGSVIPYEIGRYGGRPLVLRFGRVLHVDERSLDRFERWTARWGDPVVFFARMVPVARAAVSVPAGVAAMRRVRFLVLSAAGSLIWNVVLIYAGYRLGPNWQRATNAVSNYAHIAIPLMVLLAMAAIAWFWLRRRRRGTDAATT